MKSVRKVENIHIFLWLLKDSCWVMDLHLLGVFMIFPTIIVAFFITIKTREDIAELFHNIAVCCWVCANSVWMIGEFYYDDTTRPYATGFFVSGVLVMTYYYAILWPKLIRKQKLEDKINAQLSAVTKSSTPLERVENPIL
jgi:hypothetical protein